MTENRYIGDNWDNTRPEWLIWDTRSFCGNAMVFWGPNRGGYTADINSAGLYTEAEAKAQALSRPTDRAVPLALARQHIEVTVRADSGLCGALDAMGLGRDWRDRVRGRDRRGRFVSRENAS